MPTEKAIYLYAVLPAPGVDGLELKGLYDSDLYSIVEGDVAAVVSEVPSETRLRPERRHLAAHQGVLSKLVEAGEVVLPVSFGTAADSEKAVHSLLSRHRKALLAQIERVRGKVEMELRVVMDVGSVFEYILSLSPELKEMRDRVFDKKHEPTREEKIDLGQLFERLLEEERERHTRAVEQALSSCASEIKRNKPRNETEVMRLSVLIAKGSQKDFESALKEAAEHFDDRFSFEFTGPVPPYSFVDLRIKV